MSKSKKNCLENTVDAHHKWKGYAVISKHLSVRNSMFCHFKALNLALVHIWVCQQDSDLKHTSKMVQNLLKNTKIKVELKKFAMEAQAKIIPR